MLLNRECGMKRRLIVILFVLICGIAFLSWYFPDPVLYVFSGNLLGDSRVITGGALDQPSLHKYLFLFLLFGIPSTLFLAAQRVFADLENVVFRRTFIPLSAVFYSHTISLFAVFAYYLWRYTITMGITVPRFIGITLSIGLFLLIIRFIIWLWGYEFPMKPFSKIQTN
jgi:hypothetical protein